MPALRSWSHARTVPGPKHSATSRQPSRRGSRCRASVSSPYSTFGSGRVLLLELLLHLEDELSHRRVVEAAFDCTKAFGCDSGHEAGEGCETAFLGAGRHTRQVQELERHLGV